jgi:hypothetical protein
MRLLTIILILLLSGSATANEIDSLKKKQDVQKFLAAHLGKTGMINLYRCLEIATAKRIEMDFLRPDTFFVQDPITLEMVKTTLPRDSSFFDNKSTRFQWENDSYDTMTAKMMSKNPHYHFYKKDLDGNKRTDLVVDAGIVIIVMDMGHKFDGHIFAYSALKFHGFMSLSNGSVASLIKHDHNLCPRPLGETLENTYLTDTIIDNTINPPSVKIDTFVVVSRPYRNGPQCERVDTIVNIYGAFTKYNPQFKPGGISKIIYSRVHSFYYGHPSYRSCIEIARDGRCQLRYFDYDTTYSARLDSARSSELFDLLAYIDVKSKKDNYAYQYKNDWETNGGGSFTTYFGDGTVKTIHIWEAGPPLGLDYLNAKIAEISDSVTWKATTGTNFSCPVINMPPIEEARKTKECGCDGL